MNRIVSTRSARLPIGIGFLTFVLASFLLAGVAPPPAWAAGGVPKVYISKVRKKSDKDHVQLENQEASTVDIGGWTLSGTTGSYVIPANTTIGGGGATHTFVIDEITNSRSGRILLIDDLEAPATGESLVDQVRWGCEGGAPAPPAFPDSAALVRAPDPDLLPPQAPADDETWWTIDLDADFGLDNMAPQPLLGSSLLINEVRPSSGTEPDSVELYNPFGAPQPVDQWFLTSAAGVVFLNGIVPPLGVTAFGAPGLDLITMERVDLFDQIGVRVDQKAWCAGPPGECFGSCPDGSSPSNGYDYETSGGGSSWFGLPCTMGEFNHLDGDDFCDPTGLPGDDLPGIPIEEMGWGQMKTRFRSK